MAEILGTEGNDFLQVPNGNPHLVLGYGGNDTIFGYLGNDTIDAGAGNDIVEGLSGSNLIDGGTSDGDQDRLSYAWARGSVVVNLSTGTAVHSDGADQILGFEIIQGSNSDDTLIGSDRTDSWEGFIGGTGNDWIDGAGGLDYIDYRGAITGVVVDLSTGLVTGGRGNDTVTGIEAVIGSDQNDSIVGSADNNTITGASGSDTLDGGAGIDTVSYSLNLFFGVNVNLASSFSENAGGSAIDSIVNFENAVGSNYADVLAGDHNNNRIEGLFGRDTLLGASGDDTLLGQDEADTLVGGAGNDTLDGGLVVGWIGRTRFENYGPYGFYIDSNTASYADSDAGVSIDLSGISGTGSTGIGLAIDGLGGVDTLINIDAIIGSNFNDNFVGSDALIFEMFEGGAGDDTINGGAITDTRNFENSNRISYQNATAAVVVDLELGLATGGAGIDLIANINHMRGSASNDTLLGSSSADITEFFDGGGGNDVIDGRGGFDIVRFDNITGGVVASLVSGTATGGGTGTDSFTGVEGLFGSLFNDFLLGGSSANSASLFGERVQIFRGGDGNDTIDGGAGLDCVDYSTSVHGASVALNHTLDGAASDGLGKTDLLRNIEGVLGSSNNDTLTGSDGAAFEWFEGCAGADFIDGKGGFDRVDFVRSKSSVTVNFSTGTATDGYGGVDTLMHVEGVRGSAFDDVLIGSGAQSLESFEGREGNDTIDGGGGLDRVDYSTASVAVSVNLMTSVASDGYGGTDTLLNVEDIRGSGLSDYVLGDLSDNVFEGFAGNDTLDGGAGVDTMLGGTGDDLYLVDESTDRVAEATAAGVDTVHSTVTYALGNNVENLTLLGVDSVNATGNGLANVITGNEGNNSINGSAGDDTLMGGGGNDTLSAVSGFDQMYGGQGNDLYVVGNVGQVVVELSGEGLDTVTTKVSYTLGANVENLAMTSATAQNGTGNALDNQMIGSSAANAINGLDGNDTLLGGTGNDSLSGGNGNDSLNGGADNDVLNGGAGNDTMVGSLGDDIYIVDSTLDVVADGAGQGFDEVRSSVNYTLTNNVERLILTGTAGLSGTGNNQDNQINGNSGANALSGLNGIDIIQGAAGNDTIRGGAGNDSLTGGAGSDMFVFDTALNAATNVDQITDFASGADKIGLGSAIFTGLTAGDLATNAFFVAGTAAADANDRIVYDQTTGNLYYDADGTGATAAAQFATLGATTHPTIAFTDFLLV